MAEPQPAPIPVVLVGAGGIATAYLQAMLRTPALRLAAIVEPAAEARARHQGLAPVFARFSTRCSPPDYRWARRWCWRRRSTTSR